MLKLSCKGYEDKPNCAEDLFNMGMFYNSRCHSKWVCFQISKSSTHIRAFLYWSCPPPHCFFEAHFTMKVLYIMLIATCIQISLLQYYIKHKLLI